MNALYGSVVDVEDRSATPAKAQPAKTHDRRTVVLGVALVLAAMVVGGVAGVASGFVDRPVVASGPSAWLAESTANTKSTRGMWELRHSLGNSNLTNVVIDGFEFIRYDIDLTSSAVVREFARTENAIFPDAIQVLWNKNMTSGDLGDQANEGFVAVNLAHGDFASGAINASYTLIMDLEGNIKAASVAPESSVGTYDRYEALKLRTPGTLLMGANSALSGNGFFAWDYGTELETGVHSSPLPLTGLVGSSHDIQFIKSSDSFLVITESLDEVRLYSERGDLIWKYFYPAMGGPNVHINHAQLCEDESGELVVFLSLRDYNAIQKLNFTTGQPIWKLGGKEGDFAIKDTNGKVFEPGSGRGPWNHQHNAEYIGNHRFVMFDNAFNNSFVRSSRYLIVEVDEDAKEAQVVWEWSTGVNSLIFGDADPLPTSNVIGSFWSATVEPTGRDIRKTFEACVTEVTSDGDIAWMLGIKGTGISTDDSYARYKGEAPVGWAIYSAERFYEKPLVGRFKYFGSQEKFSFEMYDTYRQQMSTAVDVAMACGTKAYHTVVFMNPHWESTGVVLDVGKLEASQLCTLNVTTSNGQTRSTTIKPMLYSTK